VNEQLSEQPGRDELRRVLEETARQQTARHRPLVALRSLFPNPYSLLLSIFIP
jgi:hypothetical protein